MNHPWRFWLRLLESAVVVLALVYLSNALVNSGPQQAATISAQQAAHAAYKAAHEAEAQSKANHEQTAKDHTTAVTVDAELVAFATYLIEVGEHECPPTTTGCPTPPSLPGISP